MAPKVMIREISLQPMRRMHRIEERMVYNPRFLVVVQFTRVIRSSISRMFANW